MDAREFLISLVDGGIRFTHVYMNLPAIALEFLDVFYARFNRADWETLPFLHVYAFSTIEDARDEFGARIRTVWGDTSDLDFTMVKVRDVAPRKFAWCIEMRVPESVGFASEPYKKVCTSTEPAEQATEEAKQ
jgi:tRNA G37 N-methylase Trm5